VPYAPYGYPPPPRKDKTALIIVIVVLAIVLIPVAASAILYILVSGLIQQPVANRPVVTLVRSSGTATGSTILVAGAQPTVSPGQFRVNLAAGDAFGIASSLPAASDVTVSISVTGYSQPFTVRWVDIGGDGTVNGGDQFVVGFPSALPSGTSMTFFLLWYDGSAVATLQWTV